MRISPGAVTLTQLRVGSFVAKASYPSPIKGEELISAVLIARSTSPHRASGAGTDCGG
jgi:hypothetical protein